MTVIPLKKINSSIRNISNKNKKGSFRRQEQKKKKKQHVLVALYTKRKDTKEKKNASY